MKSIGLMFLRRRRDHGDGRAVRRQRDLAVRPLRRRRRRRRTRSPTGTSASSRARCACSRRGRPASAGSSINNVDLLRCHRPGHHLHRAVRRAVDRAAAHRATTTSTTCSTDRATRPRRTALGVAAISVRRRAVPRRFAGRHRRHARHVDRPRHAGPADLVPARSRRWCYVVTRRLCGVPRVDRPGPERTERAGGDRPRRRRRLPRRSDSSDDDRRRLEPTGDLIDEGHCASDHDRGHPRWRHLPRSPSRPPTSTGSGIGCSCGSRAASMLLVVAAGRPGRRAALPARATTGLPHQKHYNIPVEVAYTLVPLLVVIGLFADHRACRSTRSTIADGEPDLVVARHRRSSGNGSSTTRRSGVRDRRQPTTPTPSSSCRPAPRCGST